MHISTFLDLLLAPPAGRIADFHALRHTFSTRSARSDGARAVAKNLARHSTITPRIQAGIMVIPKGNHESSFDAAGTPAHH